MLSLTSEVAAALPGRLLSARKAVRLTQTQLAAMAGLNAPVISGLERGKSVGDAFDWERLDAALTERGMPEGWLFSTDELPGHVADKGAVRVLERDAPLEALSSAELLRGIGLRVHELQRRERVEAEPNPATPPAIAFSQPVQIPKPEPVAEPEPALDPVAEQAKWARPYLGPPMEPGPVFFVPPERLAALELQFEQPAPYVDAA